MQKKDDEVDELLKNYDGNILRIVSDKDELNKRVKHYNYVLAGDELILKNGKGHAMDGFMSSDEQKIIRKVLKKLEKYKKDVDGLPYKAPKSQKVDLRSVGSSQLRISTNRDFNFPKAFQTNDGEYNTFSNTINPIKINGKKVAGLSAIDEENDSTEPTDPYLVTVVDDKVKKVLLDKPTDPAIKDNQKFKHKKGS